ncbi:MAG: peptide chain release factor N(5)-glutamine methyltransferase [bacterium]|nr:peptide chain release factor N(5)-glutamine methyltransferase [bacterium]
MRVDVLTKKAAGRLAAQHFATPFLDAETLLAYVLGHPRVHLLSHPEMDVPGPITRRYARLIAFRSRGRPVAYLTGEKEFYGLPLTVNRHVLVPRPETETLVETALALLPAKRRVRYADIGTGAGGIAIALARYRPGAVVAAVDRSARALEIARRNAKKMSTHIAFYRGDLISPLHRHALDIVVANLPYLPTGERRSTAKTLHWEPQRALWSGRDGLNCYRRLLSQLARRTQRPRHVICELRTTQLKIFLVAAGRRLPDYRATVYPAGGGIVVAALARH